MKKQITVDVHYVIQAKRFDRTMWVVRWENYSFSIGDVTVDWELSYDSARAFRFDSLKMAKHRAHTLRCMRHTELDSWRILRVYETPDAQVVYGSDDPALLSLARVYQDDD